MITIVSGKSVGYERYGTLKAINFFEYRLPCPVDRHHSKRTQCSVEESISVSVKTIFEFIKVIIFIYPLFKKGKNRLKRRLKLRVPLNSYRALHSEVIHKMRDLSSCGDIDNSDHLSIYRDMSKEIRDILDNSCSLLALILNQKQWLNSVCACVKVFVEDNDGPKVATWSRSKNSEHRPIRHDFTPIDKNTVFSSLLGQKDGIRQWPHFRCFTCGDLFSEENYANSRKNTDWKKWYRSVLVFPIRISPDSVIGFLAFDSRQKRFFGDLPNSFKYWETPMEYHSVLEECSLYHIGGIIADTLAIIMKDKKELIVKGVRDV